ncbi:PPK2 family polyphosphate kinase [Niabella drilacis]|uniref:Polyphosphate:nucleotide phosphotransferase, PPK2 family n=1 Tax=Niabella drilacis (strain DSM 25811 / CCM 8410 / CCUG 62505 / LMG 26954 / E90) TaxID=1285928 RepID=A0A1G6IG47_NIADE|nr:PPK2 family polyphosphate kinase [Niabella drilacis]SDC05448.1 polyphosphate:nucleotide phosphotransferase, PPK2 family [Niabella drilacis]
MKPVLAAQFKTDKNFKLKNYPSDISSRIKATDAKERLKEVRKELAAFQEKLYAHNRYSVLVCLQGMDTAGKDSLIREVFEAFNVRGVVVSSFKTPSALELQHDYLWRHAIALPEKGKFGVFNRTHYENVLVTRVHPEYLLNEKIPGIENVKDLPKDFWEKRFGQINHFEEQLVENGTLLFKFFLNLSKKEQKFRLLRRLEKEKHQWKFSPGDLAERQLWTRYMDCYEEAIRHTSPPRAPWYVIPADDKDICRYLVASILLEQLTTYKDIAYPKPEKAIKEHIRQYKQQLEQE